MPPSFSLNLGEESRKRIEELAEKDRIGIISDAEKAEFEIFRRTIQSLSELQEKTQQKLAPENGTQPLPSPIEESPFPVAPASAAPKRRFARLAVVAFNRKNITAGGRLITPINASASAQPKPPSSRRFSSKSIPRDEYYVGLIRPQDSAPWDLEELEPIHPHHFAED